MTEQEIQEIVELVLQALATNSKTIEQLTNTLSAGDSDYLELSGGKKISFTKLAELVNAAAIVQATGQSETKVMSQKAVTRELAKCAQLNDERQDIIASSLTADIITLFGKVLSVGVDGSIYFDETKLLAATDIVQTTGQSTTAIMSQKAVTVAIAGAGGGTPSGHPMHDAFVSIGAVWNGTTKFWEMNMLTDLTSEEMVKIYATVSVVAQVSWNGGSALRYINGLYNLRTYPFFYNSAAVSLNNSFLSINNIVSIEFNVFTTNNIASAFRSCTRLKYIIGELGFTGTTTTTSDRAFENCPKLELVKIKGLKAPLSFADSPNLSKESILYIINNSAATSAITITLHPTAYAMAQADSEIQTALSNKPFVTLASA